MFSLLRFPFLTSILALLASGFSARAETVKADLPVFERAPAEGPNKFYPGNRAPLTASPLIKLPIGSIRPEGWLRRQLELMADGFTGRLPELSKWCQIKQSAWASRSGAGQYGWEELPYWLKGFVDLGYVLGDERIINESRQWIDGILSSQRPSGYFGPQSNLEKPDIWPNMVALYALRTQFEATGDARVLPFMKRYFQWVNTLPLEKYLPDSWQKWRGGDNLDSIHWLYNRTGEPWLLDLARLNHERTADWAGGFPTWHGVNICQCFREPAQYFQQTHDPRYFDATVRNYNTVMSLYGRAPGGMFGADENARPGYGGPRQGAESCSMVEIMNSDQMLLKISGDPIWADRCEDVAFNSLPASMTPDLKGLHYLTAPNQIQLDRQNKASMIENDGDMFSYDPASYRCCQHNVAFGWPYFAEHLWMATPRNGLAAVFYASSTVTAEVGNGVKLTIKETTDYPFRGTVHLKLAATKSAKFPLLLRIPGWCESPKIVVNGQQANLPNHAKGWASIDRTWRDGDEVRLEFPMRLEVTTWKSNKNSVSVSRGPLSYSLRIAETWKRYGGADRWPASEVFPNSAWNYGLQVDPANPENSFQVAELTGPIAPQPFTLTDAPVLLKAKGRRLTQWKQEANGMVGLLPDSPARSFEPVEEITLIPMGCARLRISAFPRLAPN